MVRKEKFRCESCNYKFFRAQMPKLCPYCGREKVGKDTSLGADELLRQV